MINPLECFFSTEVHVALDRNSRMGQKTLLMRLTPGDLSSTCPQRQLDTLAGLLHSKAALPNIYPNACMPNREAVCTVFMIVFGMTQPWLEPTTYNTKGRHAKH